MLQPESLVDPSVIAEMVEVASRSPEGCFVEVGVYKGGTAWHLNNLAKQQGRKLYAYDTFTGIPYKGEVDAHSVGDFADTSFETVSLLLPGAVVISGVFPASAVPMEPVAFAHLDCDQYRSVKESAEYLASRMAKGGIIWFDDVGCLVGATIAAEELFGDRLKGALCGKKIVGF